MNSESLRDFQLLTEISSGDLVTQRRLAKKQGLALGLTNLLIRRLVHKGYVKMVTMPRNRIRYLLTPTGLMEKARLTCAYLEYSLYFYRQIRAFLTRTLAAIPSTAGKRILLCGTGEVAEIACLLLQQNGFQIAAVVDAQATGRASFLGHPIQPLSAVPALAFDWVVVASLRERTQMQQELHEQGVAETKIIVIPDEGTPAFRAEDVISLPPVVIETPVVEASQA